MRTILFASAVWLLGSFASADAHEGHDHGAPQPVLTVPAAPRGEASSEHFEVVAVARDAEIIVGVDRFATNEPVTDAAIEVETPDGSASLTVGPDGFYRLSAPWASSPGRKDMIVTVTLGDVVDVLPITIEVPAPPPPAAPTFSSWLISPAFAQDVRARIASHDPAVLGALAGGFLLGALFMAVLGRRRRKVAALLGALVLSLSANGELRAHEGHDHGPGPTVSTTTARARDLAQRQADGSVFVPKPTQRILAIRTLIAEPTRHRRSIELPGRVIPDPSASGYVQAAAGGRLTPPSGGFPRLGMQVRQGDVLAYVTPPLQAVDRSDMRQRQGELDQQIAVVERRIARFETLVRTGATTQVQLDEARIELRGLRDRRGALDQARREPEPLVAPVSGVIAEASAIVGQMVQPNTVVFHIVDPARLWVEALSYDVLAAGPSASGRTSAGRDIALTLQGSGLADRNQSIPVHFAIEGDASGHRLGQFVTVLAPIADEAEGMAVPRAAVIRASNGQDVVYLHTAAERFEAREVRTVPLDGQRVLVLAGIERGQRVVTQGAELLDQVR
jgi:cobalt-zinc-cadmium efflux system membrane fusion protein